MAVGNLQGHLTRKPLWLKRSLPSGRDFGRTQSLLKGGGLHTVCEEARCPNIWECYSRRTATFLIMGPRCTRSCRFCAIQQGPHGPPEPEEPSRVAEAVRRMQLQYVVITSVTRDDLPRGGAEHFARTIAEIRKRCPGIKVEVLIPDFEGDETALERLLEAGPDVVNHNVETVPRLYPRVRPGALYTRSLALLSRVKRRKAHLPTKSGLMLGLGESDPEIRAALHDLVEAGCDLLTLGQYLQPTPAHLPVDRYLEPEAFDGWRRFALELGFSDVASGPLVRSSYEARALFRQGRGSGQRDERPGPQKRGISGAPCPEETPCEDI